MPPTELAPGQWTVSGPEARVNKEFSQGFTLPPPIRWTNREESTKLSIARDAPITWDPEGYTASDVMRVTIATPGSFRKAGAKPLGLVCRAPAKDGALTIPGDLLRQVEPTPPYPEWPSGRQLRLEVIPRPDRRVVFSVPSAGGGAVPVVIEYSVSYSRDVWIQ